MVKSREVGVERRMALDDILGRVTGEAEKPRQLGSFLTVSRQLGSGGAIVAERVAERLGWTVLDRQLVEKLAEKLEVSPKMIELMDETRSNWFRDAIYSLVEPRLVEQQSYVAMLGKVLLLSAYDGKVVFVGRGANFLLPREAGLRVLVLAPRSDRVARVAERLGLDTKAADRKLDELDHARADFVHRNFYADVNDPQHYDLVINSSIFGIEGSTDVVCAALELRAKGAR
jgi:cytidylate kinase